MNDTPTEREPKKFKVQGSWVSDCEIAWAKEEMVMASDYDALNDLLKFANAERTLAYEKHDALLLQLQEARKERDDANSRATALWSAKDLAERRLAASVARERELEGRLNGFRKYVSSITDGNATPEWYLEQIDKLLAALHPTAPAPNVNEAKDLGDKGTL